MQLYDELKIGQITGTEFLKANYTFLLRMGNVLARKWNRDIEEVQSDVLYYATEIVQQRPLPDNFTREIVRLIHNKVNRDWKYENTFLINDTLILDSRSVEFGYSDTIEKLPVTPTMRFLIQLRLDGYTRRECCSIMKITTRQFDRLIELIKERCFK
jgi:hypothetical protein